MEIELSMKRWSLEWSAVERKLLIETRAKVIKKSSISNIGFKFRDDVKQNHVLNTVFVKSRILKIRVLSSAFSNSSLM